MTIFIGLRAVECPPDGAMASWQKSSIKHFNPEFIKYVDEKKMLITMDDGTTFRIDDESMQIFLSAVYGDNRSEEVNK